MIPLMVIRPEPGGQRTVAAARELQLEAHGFPLFTVEPLAWSPPSPEQVDALVIGSANALRHGGMTVARFGGKPAYAVGEVTAAAARQAGLDVISVGQGGLQTVLNDLAPHHRRLLRLAGEDRITLTLPSGVTMDERAVYRTVPLPLPPELGALLAKPSVIALHAAQAAQHFSQECDRHRLDRSLMSLVAIGPRVAEAAGCGWASLATAESPDDTALLALAKVLCQRRSDGTGRLRSEP